MLLLLGMRADSCLFDLLCMGARPFLKTTLLFTGSPLKRPFHVRWVSDCEGLRQLADIADENSCKGHRQTL